MASSQEQYNGGFELLQERPPQSLLRRFWVTLGQLAGLVFGGAAAFVRDRRAAGQRASILLFLIRVLLFFAWPFLDRRLVREPFPVQFRVRLERLGPTYIKLGQILSLRQDLLPRAITDELQNLLDRLPVVPFERYIELIQADLRQPVAQAFAWIDPIPLGSASLAQTHRAGLRTGEQVVLKVIKPGVRETVEQDVKLLRLVGRTAQIFLARYQPRRIINEFCAYTLREVDLRFEADNAETFLTNFRDNPHVRFPQIYRTVSGRDVLCMDFFSGEKPSAAAAARLTGAERRRILDLGVSSIVQMIFHDGFFHADLHPGNMVIFDDLTIGFIDLGMVGRIDEATRRAMLYYFYALVMGDPENAARILTNVAVPGNHADLPGLRRELTDLNRRWASGSQFRRISLAQLVLQSINLAGRYRIYYPEAIILMTKALVTIEGVGNLLDPNLELTAVARRHVQQIVLSQFDPIALWRKTLISAPEVIDIFQRSPLIVAHALQQLEQQNQTPPAQPMAGLKETVLAGLGLVALAVLMVGGAPWFLWLPFLLMILALALRGLR